MVEEIKKMTVVELADLVKAIEEEFGVSAVAAAAPAAAARGLQSAKTERTNRGSSTAARLHDQLAQVLLTQVLGEQQGPVGLNGVVGGLEELCNQNRLQNGSPSQCSRY